MKSFFTELNIIWLDFTQRHRDAVRLTLTYSLRRKKEGSV